MIQKKELLKYKLEKDFRKASAKYLKSREDVYAFKIHGSGWGVSGISDVIGVKRTPVIDLVAKGVKEIGVFIAIEEKAEKGKPSPKQITFIEKIKSMAGLAGVTYCIKDIENILDM